MALNNYEKGNIGENTAYDYLKKKGYQILERNYRYFTGEIDIIAQYENYIIFVEVKYRKTTINGYPREAVKKSKQNKIRKTALYYISEKNVQNNDFRFDVVEILDKNIEHIENAF